jgi:hypothetical protein
VIVDVAAIRRRYTMSMQVIADEREAPVELTLEQERELDESIAEADRGDVVSAAELFRRLSR